MQRWIVTALLILLSLAGGTASALEKSDIGVVVLHGKWDSPDGHVSGLADYLRREGFRVTRPEMSWSGRRGYDQGVEGMVAEIDQAVEELRKAGAKKIYVAGHSQGAAGALYYAGRQPVSGIALIAAGGHAQGKVFVPHYAPYVAEAKNRIAQGKGAERMPFVDLNTGGRTRRLDAPAQSVADYFDTEGPFNTFLSAARVKPDTAVLLLIPRQETEGLKRLADQIKDKLPEGTRAQSREIDADHLHAPDASKAAIRDWLLAP
jgi:pimeloyl-ACP methyl ester carboxylesterase